MVPSPWQFFCAWSSNHSLLFLIKKKTNHNVGPFALLARWSTLWLLTFPKYKNCSKKMPIFWCFWYSKSMMIILPFLAKKQISKSDHPPFSPDLAPCDFWLLSNRTVTSSDKVYCSPKGVLCTYVNVNKIFISSFQQFYCQTSYSSYYYRTSRLDQFPTSINFYKTW